MKYSSLSFAAAAFAALVPAISAAQIASPAVNLPRGTVVHLVTMAPLSAAENKSGDEFYLEVADDVSVGGVVVIPRGSPAAGHVYAPAGTGVRSLRARVVAVRVNGVDVPLHGSVKLHAGDLPLGSMTSGATNAALPVGSAL